jgi:hypothetical protein
MNDRQSTIVRTRLFQGVVDGELLHFLGSNYNFRKLVEFLERFIRDAGTYLS